MIDLSIDLCGIKLSNPTILPSGILGTTKALLKRVAENGAGAVTIKSVSIEAREGHKNPTIIPLTPTLLKGEKGGLVGMMNAVGYSNPGVEDAVKEFTNLNEVGVPVIASVVGTEAKDFARVAERLSDNGFVAIEIPLSCPHTPGFGILAGHGTPEATFKIVSAVRKVTTLPIFVKLSPNVLEIGRIAKAAEDAGANAITAVNTMGPGMIINIEAKRPVLDFKVGGISGAALRPVAVRCVYDIFETVKIPIIGIGGISTGQHAVEMFMAGASAVGIGTAVYDRGINVFKSVCNEMTKWMADNGYSSVSDLRGIAHD
ncbi:MAG: dihydroorotate dehydrogenase [Candidatus Brocadiales bacterium]